MESFPVEIFQMYKRRDPSTPEEVEMVENLFDSLCSALMHPSNRGRFLRGEGLQLMNLMLRSVEFSTLLRGHYMH